MSKSDTGQAAKRLLDEGLALTEKGRLAPARASFEDALRLLRRDGSDEAAADAGARAAHAAWLLGDIRGAGRLLRPAIATDAPRGRLVAAELLVAKGELDAASRELDRIAARGVDAGLRLEKSLLQARMLGLRGQLAEARRVVRRVSSARSCTARLGARAAFQLAELALASGQVREADERGAVAVQAARSQRDLVLQVDALIVRAAAQRHVGAISAAKNSVRRASSIAKRVGYTRGQAHCHMEHGWCSWTVDDMRAAMQSFETARQIFDGSADVVGSLLAQYAIGATVRVRDEYGLAARTHRHVRSAASRRFLWPLAAHASEELGLTLLLAGDYDRASDALDESLETFRRCGITVWAAKAHEDLGEIFVERGELERADDHLRIAMKQFTSAGIATWTAWTLSMTAYVEMTRGRLRSAEAKIRESGDICRRIRDRTGLAEHHYELAEVHRLNERYGDAARELRRAIAISKTLSRHDDRDGDAWGEATARLALAQLSLDAGRARRAREELERLLRSFDLEDPDADRHLVASCALALAEVHADAGDVDAAQTGAEAARSMFLREGIREGLARCDLLVGRLNKDVRRLRAAERRFEELHDLRGRSMALYQLALCSRDRSQHVRALDLALSAIASLEEAGSQLGTGTARLRLYRRHRPIYLLALDLAAARGDGDSALRALAASRAEALRTLLRQDAFDVEGPLANLWREVAELEALVGDRPSPGTAARGGWRRGGDEGPQQFSEAERRLGRRYRQLRQAVGHELTSVLDASDGPADVLALRHGEHVILYEYEPADDGSASIWRVSVSSDEPVQVQRIDLGRREQRWIQRLARSTESDQRTVLDARRPEWVSSLGDKLLPRRLFSSDRDRARPAVVFIIPSGKLWAVPWAALEVGGEKLVEVAAVSLLPSLALLKPARSVSGIGSLGYWTSPAGVERERRTLAAAFPPLDEPQTADGLLETLERSDRYAAAVLGVHGQARRGLGHYLDLHHGRRLSAARLLTCRLPPLLGLGACWSGRADFTPGSEPIGLASVALSRGASAVVAGLFAVADDPGVEQAGQILAATYRGVGEGAPAPLALQEAQLDYLAANPLSTIRDWAGFVVFGGTTS